MTRRLTLHLIAGMLILAVALAGVEGFVSYGKRSADYRDLGSQNALLGAKITQYILERAVDNGLFDREALFGKQYKPVDGHGTARYRTEYDPFFDRNVVKILEAFRANGDIQYAYVVNNDGYVPAHTERRISKTKIAVGDGSPAKGASGRPREVSARNSEGCEFCEYRAPILVGGLPWGEFCVGIPAALANHRSREVAARTLFTTMSLALAIVGAMVCLIRRNLRPLEELTGATRQMAAGDLSVRCGYRGRDELGTLARSFNAMVETISQTQEGLERQVEQRTADFRESEESYRRLFADNRAVMLQVDLRGEP